MLCIADGEWVEVEVEAARVKDLLLLTSVINSFLPSNIHVTLSVSKFWIWLSRERRDG